MNCKEVLQQDPLQNRKLACEARLRKPCVQLLLGAPANHNRYSPNDVREDGLVGGQ